MLSLAKLGRGREDYYLRSIGADASQYYSERGEVAGAWVGGGAEVLGLRGQVQDAALLALLAATSRARSGAARAGPVSGWSHHLGPGSGCPASTPASRRPRASACSGRS